ncbi:hypothetical protein F2P81_014970 [Scophthalmus maximus]|uniref:Modulator of smoothened protein n=1 Tax=Scophthalmus maximus TaxID=52904 RepID=A0A6A4SLF1_SCOMX|nr:hypothetical protein F2P81_014970 [Scophthalmus maximus]
MDKLTIISGCLFLAADIFAIASIANPDWINTGESAGALTVGLVRQCQTIHGRDRTCIPPRLPPEWVTTLFFIIMGIISLTVTCGLLVASHWRREATKYARWIAFTGMILFCMAALIFPIGFYINEVGGQPYKLPNNTVVGSSFEFPVKVLNPLNHIITELNEEGHYIVFLFTPLSTLKSCRKKQKQIHEQETHHFAFQPSAASGTAARLIGPPSNGFRRVSRPQRGAAHCVRTLR